MNRLSKFFFWTNLVCYVVSVLAVLYAVVVDRPREAVTCAACAAFFYLIAVVTKGES